MFKYESFIQYSFLKNLFLSFFIVNFYFVVELFFKADRGIFEITPPLFLTPLNPHKIALKIIACVLCELFYYCEAPKG
ncbi:hypothetical protein OUK_0399 [Helicobacter pylori R037c]|nr:hypothetical protein OUK_0399 [Helicobacter pylori R037c]